MSPFDLALRSLHIAWIFLTGLLGYLYRRLVTLPLEPEELELERGQVLATALEKLGATFIKFGQILGTRPDLLGPGYIEALRRLHDEVPAAPYEAVRGVLAEELKEKIEAFESIDETPLAAASVAQVHEGRLLGGERVAIKILRPEARAQIVGDLAILRLGARLLDAIPTLHLLSLPGAVERFGEALSAQLDFRLEAENNRRLSQNFAEFEGVRFPRIHEALSGERVLTMELIEGHKGSEHEKVQHHRKRFAELGGHAILKMIFQDGFVHADLHPGNLFLMEDGTLVFIDLGMVAEIPAAMMRPWIDTFAALARRDGPAVARLFYGHAPTVGNTGYAVYERDIIDFFRQFEDKRLGEVESSVVIAGATAILRRHHIQADPVFTVVNLAILVAEGLGKQLDPEVDLVQMATPYLIEAALTAPPGRPPLREIPRGER